MAFVSCHGAFWIFLWIQGYLGTFVLELSQTSSFFLFFPIIGTKFWGNPRAIHTSVKSNTGISWVWKWSNCQYFSLIIEQKKYNCMYCKRLYFRVNLREHRDAKIKSSPIISIIRNIEEDMANRENKVS